MDPRTSDPIRSVRPLRTPGSRGFRGIRACLALAASLLGAPAAPAQTVVTTGDDLAAVVAAAAHGDEIVIQSDATFVGTLSWTSKHLILRAGVGYHPTLRGSPDQPALRLTPSPGFGSSVWLRGLRLEPGVVPPGGSARPAVLHTGTAPTLPYHSSNTDFEDCLVLGDVEAACTGGAVNWINLKRTRVVGAVEVSGTGSAYTYLGAADGADIDELRLENNGQATNNCFIEELRIRGELRIRPLSSGEHDVFINRSRLEGPVVLQGGSSTGISVFMESCLLRGPGSGTALFARSIDVLEADNLTITDYAVGLDAELPASFANLLIFDVADCLAPVVLPAQIRRSLIEDGTYQGLLGNLGGKPWIDANLALLPGSKGIDHGDNSAISQGNEDLFGDPRYQDNDGDGVVRINCGAVESLGTCAQAEVTPYNGSGSNPQFLAALTKPKLGQPFVASIAYGPQTAATLLALGVPSPTPLFLSGVEGEILLDLSLFPTLDFASGTHVIPVPSSFQYCGVELAVQGLRIDLPGGIPLARCGNGLKLVLGQ